MLNTVYPLKSRVSRAEDFFFKTAKNFLQKEKQIFREKIIFFRSYIMFCYTDPSTNLFKPIYTASEDF